MDPRSTSEPLPQESPAASDAPATSTAPAASDAPAAGTTPAAAGTSAPNTAQPRPAGAPVYPETASATTDHANNHSGKFAYVLVAVLVCLLILGGHLLGNLAAGIGAIFITSNSDYVSPDDLYSEPLPGWPDSLFGDDDSLNPFGDNSLDDYFQDGTEESPFSNSRLDLEQAIELYLDTFSINLNELIAATDYAGATNNVRSAVKNLAQIDGTTQASVTASLQAALGELDRNNQESALVNLNYARDAAETGFKEALAYKLPQDLDPAIKDELTTYLREAQSLVAERWQTVAQAFDALAEQNTRGISERDFYDPIYDATDAVYNDAYAELLDALELSADNR